MRSTFNFILLTISFLAINQCGTVESSYESFDLVIYGGRVMDPASGLDSVRNVGIRNGTIIVITQDSLMGKEAINASGFVVSPGFVDLHEHGKIEESYRLMVRDGVTTAFELEVGTSDVERWYQERDGGQLVNYGVSIGHIPVRMAVLGDSGDLLPSGPAISQPASEDQIAEMKKRIQEGLEQGAVAVGFGLDYTPAASMKEYETMLGVASGFGASSHIHVKNTIEGLNQAILGAANADAALHIVHVNSSGGGNTAEFLEIIIEARNQGQDVTTEAYPYEAGMTKIETALFDDWESWSDEYIAKHQWVATGEWLTRESFGRYREEGGHIIIHERTEDMTLTAIENPIVMIASDGFFIDGNGHPRTSGTFSKILGKYVREDGVLTLMEALRKMTIEPVRRLDSFVPAMKNKGRIRAGADADITIFDPETVIDRATYIDPTLPSEGIEYVLVGGLVVVDDGELVPNVRPGKAIRNPVTSK